MKTKVFTWSVSSDVVFCDMDEFVARIKAIIS